jgi:hypothetical protein
MTWQKVFGEMGLVLFTDATEKDRSSQETSEESSDEIESEEKEESSSNLASSPAMPLPDATEFPLLYSIFSSQPQSNMDMLIHELVKIS